MLPWSVFFEHRVCVFPHHVIDGFDNVHHFLERRYGSTKWEPWSQALFRWQFEAPCHLCEWRQLKGLSSADERKLENKLKGLHSGSLLLEIGQWKILLAFKSCWVSYLFLSIILSEGLCVGLGWICLCTDEPTPHFWKTLSPLHNSFEWLGLGGCVCIGWLVPVITTNWNRGGHLTEAELLCFSLLRSLSDEVQKL